MESQLLESQTGLDEAYRLTVDMTREHPDAELIVLPSRAPIVAKARLERVGVLTGFFREASRRYEWNAEAGQIYPADEATTPGETIYIPPETSEHIHLRVSAIVTLERPAGGGAVETAQVIKTAELQLLTPTSSQRMAGGVLDGYAIGEYLDPAQVKSEEQVKRHPDRYQVPEWFYKVTPELKPLKIAPDFELGFFMIDFPWKSLGATQYIALDLNLVRKLQDLIDMMRADGHTITRFVPVYGFRPPAFNLGTIQSENATTLKVPFSMHQYGRAVDLIIDESGEGILDDLNGDGVVDVKDAKVILKYVNRLDRQYLKAGRMEMVGGAGVYTHTDFLERAAALGQTPYIHVDTRGFVGEAGDLIRWEDTWKPIGE